MVNQARLKSQARSHGPDGWEGSNKREIRIESRNSVLFFVLFIMWSTNYKFWLCSSLLYFVVPSVDFWFLVSFSVWEKYIPSSFCLCRWFLNSDCSYDSAVPKESKAPSHPIAPVMYLNLTQGTAMESCSTAPWCMKILQEAHPGDVAAAAPVGIVSAEWFDCFDNIN